jgi:hypothetical protein
MKHTLHKVIILAGCFCFGSLSTGLAYRFDPDGVNVLVQNAETAHHMVNILLQYYHDHPDELDTVAVDYAAAFIECLNEFGSREVLSWQLFGTQGYIQAYVEDGIEDGRDEFQNWQDLHNAFFSGFREAFLDVQPILEDYFIELNALAQAQQDIVEEDQGDVIDMRADEQPQAWVGDGNRF